MNGPKVNFVALVKLNYMLEYPGLKTFYSFKKKTHLRFLSRLYVVHSQPIGFLSNLLEGFYDTVIKRQGSAQSKETV